MDNATRRIGIAVGGRETLSDATLPIPRNPRYLTIDLWRGLACLMIVVLHAAHNAHEGRDSANLAGKLILSAISKMPAGVPMFFVISGYCIAATSDSTRRRPSAPKQFFIRRFRRIYPPFWVIVFLTLLLTVALTIADQVDLFSYDYGLIPMPSRLSFSQWLGNLTLTETWRFHLFGDPELKILGPSWTLCYEEQFYAVCGLILFIAPRRFFAGMAVITIMTLALAPIGGTVIQGFFFDGGWLMFAEGVAVYYLLNYSKTRFLSLILFTLMLSVTAALRYGVPGVSANELLRNRLWDFLASTSFGLTLILLHPWDRRTAEARVLRPLAVCGQMCYSLYLVHWPITVVMTAAFYRAGVRGVWQTLLIVAPLTIVASLAASWLFHLAVERRFLNSPIVRTEPDLSAIPMVETFAPEPLAHR